MRIDLSAIDRTQFQISGAEWVLINPRRDKHVWADNELWFRSIVTDHHGHVLSMGFPKFMNYHENPDKHDKAIREAERIYSLEKADGTLIILSFVDGKPYFRTRGCLDLGDFHEPVHRLITECYGWAWIEEWSQNHSVSLLFEYVAPTNQIVVKYSNPGLFFLGYVDWAHGPYVENTPESLMWFEERTGIPAVTVVSVGDPKATMQNVSSWDDSEGIVVCCEDRYGEVTMFKVKSEWYLMMHALRFQMTSKKLRMLLVLEHELIKCFEDLKLYLYDFGYDYEIAVILEEETNNFFNRLQEGRVLLSAFLHQGIYTDRLLDRLRLGEIDRKTYVEQVKNWITYNQAPEWIFSYAMALVDEKDGSNYLLAHAAEETLRTVTDWRSRKQELISTLIKTPKDFDDEEADS